MQSSFNFSGMDRELNGEHVLAAIVASTFGVLSLRAARLLVLCMLLEVLCISSKVNPRQATDFSKQRRVEDGTAPHCRLEALSFHTLSCCSEVAADRSPSLETCPGVQYLAAIGIFVPKSQPC